MIEVAKCFKDGEILPFKAIDNRLLKRYIKIWKKISTLMNIKSDGEPIYGGSDIYTEIKIKVDGDRVNTNFQGKKMPKERIPCKWLSLIMVDSAVEVNKKYHPQTFFEDKITEENKNNIINYDFDLSLVMYLTANLIINLIMNLLMILQ